MIKTDVALGIDIGGTNTQLGFVDHEGNCLAVTSLPTHAEEPVDKFLPRLYQSIDATYALVQQNAEMKGIGIGAPNANYYRGTIEMPPNLSWGPRTDLVELIRQRYPLPVVITNDAKAAALGEMKFGVAKGMKDFILITLGTGLGSGIVSNGQLVYGHDGFAGELGHTIVNTNGRVCGCGRKGCLETYVSATGIRRTVYKLLADYTDASELREYSFNDLTANMITEAALRGDPIAIQAFEYTGRVLGMKLADAVAHSGPEAIILFGGLTRAADYIFGPTKRYMEQFMLNIFKNKVKLLSSGLSGANTAVLGASALLWTELDRLTKN